MKNIWATDDGHWSNDIVINIDKRTNGLMDFEHNNNELLNSDTLYY